MAYTNTRRGSSLTSALTHPHVVRACNLLGLPENASTAELWSAAQQLTLYIASYCREKHLSPAVTAIIFGVTEKCENHEQVALLGAQNLVHAYQRGSDTSGVSS